jgi:hypothetical protein
MALSHIGTVEHIDIPEYGLSGIPAKIDTGADGSSIWASGIKLDNSVLSFYLFAPGSVFYRDEPIATTIYRITSVKNSFGDKEFRYKIKLKVQIGSIKLTRWFTLADRSRNNYPVLLGKNFLKNKFIVDVAQRHLISEMRTEKEVAVFTEKQQENEAFFKEVATHSNQKIKYDCISYKNVAFYIDGVNSKVIHTENGKDLADYDFTYFKDHHNHEIAFSIAEYLHFKNRPFADKEFYDSLSASKLSEYLKLASHDISVPPTFCAQIDYMCGQFETLTEWLGLPFVLKEMKSDRGKNNYLIATKADFTKILDEAPEKHIYLAQKFMAFGRATC